VVMKEIFSPKCASISDIYFENQLLLKLNKKFMSYECTEDQ